MDQVETHLFWQQHDLHQWMERYHVQHEAWGPLAQHCIAEVVADPVLLKIAARYGKTATQVVLHYNVQRGIVVTPKSTKRERMEEDIDLFAFSLRAEDREDIRTRDEDKSPWCAYEDPLIVEYAMS